MGGFLGTSSEEPSTCESPSTIDYPKFTYKEREYYYIGDHKEELEKFECPICFKLINEPVQTSCGHLFCAQCIKDIRNECPYCRQNNFTTTNDSGFLTRMISSVYVLCPNQNRGCVWTGTLGEALHHLENKCNYEEAKCANCEHRGDRREVTHLHPTWCESFPLPCPNQPGCGTMVTRATLEDHLKECPEQLLECEYAPAGCTVTVNRKNAEEHMQRETERHGHLWKERIKQLSAVFLAEQANGVGNGALETGRNACYRPWLNNPCLKEQPTPPYILTITRQSTSVSGRFEAESDPFYSHAGGYKFYLHVSSGSYIDASIHLLEGENDDKLMFPFKGTLTLTLMNQLTDRDHQEKTVQLNTLDDSGNTSNVLSHCVWEESSSSVPSYLQGGCLYVRVSPIDFDHEYMSTCLPV